MRRAAIDDVEVGRRYLAGDSERRLVAAFGVSRDAIRRRLDEQGIVRRSRAEAGRARYHRLDAAARQAAVAGARAANTGRQHSEEHLTKMARARELRAALTAPSSGAAVLARAMQARGLVVHHQRAVGRYNVDLAVGSVAVEILTRRRSGTKLSGARVRYLLDRRYTVLCLWVDGRRTTPLAPQVIQHVVRTVEDVRRRPAGVPTYTVLHRDGQIIDHGIRANATFERVPGPHR